MASAAPSPYVGPRPFERTAEDRARFFGRDREVEEIVSLILSHPLVLVYAQSGAGKTSLFNTAVAEALERRRVELLPLARVRAAAPGGDGPPAVNLYVATALGALAPERDREELAGLALGAFLGVSERPRTLVFDQFEELFTSELVYELYGDDWQLQQEAFFVQVAEALAADPLLRVVFLIRKEYLAELERFTPLLPERLQTRFHLEPLDRTAALAAVRGPLEGTRRSFADGVAETLVDRLLAMRVGPQHDVHGRFVEPVQLQLVCRSLWQELPPDATTITEADVRAFGDVDTVLGQFYDAAVRAASVAARTRESRLRARIERDFVTSIGTRGTVYLNRDWARRSAALDELERLHVIHAEWRAGTRWYELTHDRLIDPIRASNESFRRRLARRRLALVAVVPLLVAAGVVAFLASRSEPGGVTTVANPVAASSLAQQGAATGVLRATLPAGGPVVASAPVGNGIASVTADGTLTMVVLVRSSASRIQVGDGVVAAGFSPDGRVALIGHDDGGVAEWNLRTGRRLGLVHLAAGVPSGIAFAPDGRRAAISAGDVVSILDLATLRFTVRRSFRAPVTSLAFAPGGRTFAAGLETGLVALAPFRGRVRYFVGGPKPVDAVAVSPDGTRLLGGSRNTTARIWSIPDGRLLLAIPVGSGAIEAAAFAPDGHHVLTAGEDFLAFVWRWRPYVGLDLTHTDQIKRFQRRHRLGSDGRIGPRTRAAVQQLGSMSVLVGHTGAVTSAVFSPDGNRAITGGADGTTRVWGFFGAGATVRTRIVQAALDGARDAARIGFRRYRPMLGVSLQIRLPDVPSAEDATSFVTWCYWQAGAPDPNGRDYDGTGFTGTLLQSMRHVPRSAVRPGDLVVWTPPAPGYVAALVVSAGRDPLLVVNSSEAGPSVVRFSAERRRLAAAGHGTPIWLTEDVG